MENETDDGPTSKSETSASSGGRSSAAHLLQAHLPSFRLRRVASMPGYSLRRSSGSLFSRSPGRRDRVPPPKPITRTRSESMLPIHTRKSALLRQLYSSSKDDSLAMQSTTLRNAAIREGSNPFISRRSSREQHLALSSAKPPTGTTCGPRTPHASPSLTPTSPAKLGRLPAGFPPRIDHTLRQSYCSPISSCGSSEEEIRMPYAAGVRPVPMMRV